MNYRSGDDGLVGHDLVLEGQEDEPEDELEQAVQEWVERDPDFTRVLAAAERTRALVKALAQARARAGLTQAEVARRMGSTQSAVARLERGEIDPRLSTIGRYAEVVGWRLDARSA